MKTSQPTSARCFKYNLCQGLFLFLSLYAMFLEQLIVKMCLITQCKETKIFSWINLTIIHRVYVCVCVCPTLLRDYGSHESQTWWDGVTQLSAEPVCIFLVNKVKGQCPAKVKGQGQISNCSDSAEIWYECVTWSSKKNYLFLFPQSKGQGPAKVKG